MPEIIYFENAKQKSNATLKHFLKYLKIKKVPAPIRFSFIDEKGPLIPTLSLRDNISLESIPSTVSSDKEFTLEDYLERRGNDSLTKLYNNIRLLEDFPCDVDSQTLKIASLIKGLLQDGQYLLLENPERFLNKENRQLFIDALIYQLKQRRQTLLLESSTPDIWAPYITQRVDGLTSLSSPKGNIKLQNQKVFLPKSSKNILPLDKNKETFTEQSQKSSSDPKAA